MESLSKRNIALARLLLRKLKAQIKQCTLSSLDARLAARKKAAQETAARASV